MLALGITASIAANVLHARPSPVSQVISAWPPLALMLTVELISRVPTHQRLLAAVRMIAAAPIAAIAAWVSYSHMAGVAARYGETQAAAAYLLPLSVDGLVVVASVSLVEITGRLRTATTPSPDGLWKQDSALYRQPDDPSYITALTVASQAPHPSGPCTARRSEPMEDTRPARSSVASAPSTPAVPPPSTGSEGTPAGDKTRTPTERRPEPGSGYQGAIAEEGDRTQNGEPGVEGRAEATPRARCRIAASTARSTEHPPSPPHGDPADGGHSHRRAGGHEEAVPSDTASAVAYWHRRDPGLHPAQIAARIGRSERTVRRHWPLPTSDTPHANRNVANSVHR
ncbi:DUF2637 domain-containing protein [Micromonospora mangrovi]|uniref:DUF2637 domain-containing protein n=2 Tax=Micromonospora TaxID=1873 RepID=A0AAU7MB08_9ACTN